MPPFYSADPALLTRAGNVVPDDEGVRVKTGLIVSGDSFIHEPDEAQRILAVFPKALAGEMEAAAVAQTCFLFDIPFVIARSVSDVIGSGGNAMEYEEFLPLAASRSVDFVMKMLEENDE